MNNLDTLSLLGTDFRTAFEHLIKRDEPAQEHKIALKPVGRPFFNLRESVVDSFRQSTDDREILSTLAYSATQAEFRNVVSKQFRSPCIGRDEGSIEYIESKVEAKDFKTAKNSLLELQALSNVLQVWEQEQSFSNLDFVTRALVGDSSSITEVATAGVGELSGSFKNILLFLDRIIGLRELNLKSTAEMEGEREAFTKFIAKVESRIGQIAANYIKVLVDLFDVSNANELIDSYISVEADAKRFKQADKLREVLHQAQEGE